MTKYAVFRGIFVRNGTITGAMIDQTVCDCAVCDGRFRHGPVARQKNSQIYTRSGGQRGK
jgi:hypothetical protein